MKRLRFPRRTLRFKLTLLYGAMFLLCGGVLLAITNIVVRGSTTTRVAVPFPAQIAGPGALLQKEQAVIVPAVTGPPGAVIRRKSAPVNAPAIRELRKAQQRLRDTQVQVARVNQNFRQVFGIARSQPAHELHQLLITSLIAMAAMAIVSIGLGWLVAGRVLRPLRTITATARDISASSLDRRLALAGPDDELHELGDTFDALLGRLESSFEAQRQFVANASHELRTPLARQRTVAEVALADPDATVESLRASHERVLAAGEQQERLIEALLTLARSERGLARRESFDLASVVEDVVEGRRAELAERGLALEASLSAAPAFGDPRLAERLAANLIDNALSHNVPAGSVRVATRADAHEAILSVSNTGPVVPADQVERLVQPFQRLDGDRVAEREGLGLGLAIADAIARAHGGTLSVRARSEGGLDVEARLPV